MAIPLLLQMIAMNVCTAVDDAVDGMVMLTFFLTALKVGGLWCSAWCSLPKQSVLGLFLPQTGKRFFSLSPAVVENHFADTCPHSHFQALQYCTFNFYYVTVTSRNDDWVFYTAMIFPVNYAYV